MILCVYVNIPTYLIQPISWFRMLNRFILSRLIQHKQNRPVKTPDFFQDLRPCWSCIGLDHGWPSRKATWKNAILRPTLWSCNSQDTTHLTNAPKKYAISHVWTLNSTFTEANGGIWWSYFTWTKSALVCPHTISLMTLLGNSNGSYKKYDSIVGWMIPYVW